jgi:hypothetical protein
MDMVKEYAPVGECIYCGRRPPQIKLTREHILAYSLGGDAILRDASCSDCAKITRDIETYCADEIFVDIRAQHNVHSRSGPKKHLVAHSGLIPNVSEGVSHLVPTKDYPGMLILPSFDLPGIVAGRGISDGFPSLTIHGWSINHDHEDRWVRTKLSSGASSVIKREIDPFKFGRMLAKVAHGIAVAELGSHAFKPKLGNVILKGDCVPYFVGCASDKTPPPVPMKTWVRVEIREIRGKKYVTVFLRLFAYVGATVNETEKGTPTYSVIVGEFLPWRSRLTRCIVSFLCSSGRTPSLAL